MNDIALGPSGRERRRAERVPMSTGAPVSVVGARLVNLSTHGMLIDSPIPMKPEACLPLRLLVEGKRVDVEARVTACNVILVNVFSESRRWRSFGISFEFKQIPVEGRRRLAGLLGVGS
jgi:hypothetical protein